MQLLSLVILIVLGGWCVKSCEEWLNKPETPEQISARKKAEEAEAKRWYEDRAKQPYREKLINDMLAEGVFRRIEWGNHNAVAWVDTTFYLLPFEQKQSFCGVIYAFLANKQENEYVEVLLRDNLSGREIGDYSMRFGGPTLEIKKD